MRWSTNLCCNIDPLELVIDEGFVPGYQAYDTMCLSSICAPYDNGVPILDFEPVDATMLARAGDGSAPSCGQCEVDADCDPSEVCNSAGLCE